MVRISKYFYFLVTTGELPSYLYEEGPVTRRKENLLMKINEEPIHELNSVQKFDEYFKNNKNVEHEAYFYKKPRIDQLYYQADLRNIEQTNANLNKPEETKTPMLLESQDSKRFFSY